MINKIIRNYLAKQAAGRADDGIMITLRDPQKIQMLENIMADLLMRNGIDPRAITNEKQLINIINRIQAFEKKNLADNIRGGITDTESAKIFNLKGKEIPKGSKIMGGEAVENQKRFFKGVEIKDPTFDENLPFDSDAEKLAEIRMSNEAYEQIPPGSRGGADDIAAPVQSAEETLKNMIQAENKKNIAKMRQRKMLDEAIDDASPGFSGDRNVDAELVAENLAERMGMVYDDLPTKERIKLYDEAYQGLTRKKFTPDDSEDFAKGGIARIGLKDGMNRRTFLKIFSGLVSLPIIGKVLKPFKVGKTVTKVPIIKTDNVPGKPEWFDQLVNKVILEGDDVTKRFATKEREIVHAKQIDEDNYVTVTQDLDEGVVRVEYENPYATMFGDKVDLRYKKPPPDEGDPRPVGEFQTQETGIVGRAQGPDDYDLEIEGMSGRAIEDLESDVSALKQYATGEKPTLKEIVQNKKRRDKVSYYETPEGQSEYVAQRQGEYDGPYEDDFASGGLAGMLGE